MSSPELLKDFSKSLLRWYQKNARDLPWRKTTDPYQIWISEVMLQQTTVATVIPYFERWIKNFPDVESVALAPLQTILQHWQGLGYYQRAKNLHLAAQMVVEKFSSQLPDGPKELRTLPGFGPYTVGAVLSIAFNQRFPIIDANVRRVVMRQLGQEGMADTSHDAKILKFLDHVMPQQKMRFFNQALMELGALVCRVKEPICLSCPIKQSCRAYEKGIQEIIPTPKKKILKDVQAVIGLIKKENKFFIQQRPSKGLLADLWEFPGGKVESPESLLDALKRELKEELAVELLKAKPVITVKHFYTSFRVHLNVFDCVLQSLPKLNSKRRWVSLNEIDRFPMPSGSAKIVAHLKKP